jgi:hypothetical protein
MVTLDFGLIDQKEGLTRKSMDGQVALDVLIRVLSEVEAGTF